MAEVKRKGGGVLKRLGARSAPWAINEQAEDRLVSLPHSNLL